MFQRHVWKYLGLYSTPFKLAHYQILARNRLDSQLRALLKTVMSKPRKAAKSRFRLCL